MAEDRIETLLAQARRAEPGFGLARQQSAIWRVRRGLQAKRRKPRLVAALAAAACLAGVALAAFSWFKASTQSAVVDERWQLRDGSRILIETPATRITKQRESDSEVLFELTKGAARFDVARRPERAFRVQAGPALVEVIGTLFRVERQGERTLVSVERGRVSVSSSGARHELSAGEHGLFPPQRPDSTQELQRAHVEAAPSSSVQETGRAAPLAPDSLASGAAPSAEALFALADRARLEGRSLEATRTLRQLTQRFPRDARAPLAAFTLGRLLLENLRQPADAARAFELARSLAGGSGALAEDALAREVEAWRAAGDASKATARAQRYQALYPNGTHSKQVLRAGDPLSKP